MDKRTILAFILIGVVILFYDDYVRWMYPPSPESQQDTTASRYREPDQKRAVKKEHVDPYIDQAFTGEPETQPESETPTVEFFGLNDTIAERTVFVESDLFRARLSTFGAGITSFVLKPNGRYLKKEVELINDSGNHHPSFKFWTINGPVESSNLKYRIAWDDNTGDKTVNASGPGAKRELVFAANIGPQQTFEVVYTFTGESYSFLCEVKGEGLNDIWVRDYAEVEWRGGLAPSEIESDPEFDYSYGYTYYSSDVLEKLTGRGKKPETEGPTTGDTRWAAIRTKYFMAALIPENTLALGGWMQRDIDESHQYEKPVNRLSVGLRVPVENGIPTTPIRIFAGPLDDDVLSSIDPSLKRVMNWGSGIPVLDEAIKPISKVVLWSLKRLHGFVPNYGICIIIFSILVKLIIWPLTRKSYQSMSGMQRLQPKMKELREKYKNDQQRMQKELMKLYKEEKVNPMGGCLPIMLQMPLLISMFTVFRWTIEFRRASFIWWISDLSRPDVIFNLPFTLPFYGSHVAVLPILMAVSSYYQSKITMTDPNQKAMLYFMPIFMLVLFNGFPSGLTMYYTLFNIWTLVQQKITPPPHQNTQENKLPKS